MRYATKHLICTIPLLLAAPAAGLLLVGIPAARYFVFPPAAELYIQHAEFNSIVFILGVLCALLLVTYCIRKLLKAEYIRQRGNKQAFPIWGWLGLLAGCLCWVIAWNRFAWMGRLQEHTFTPLWLCYVVVVNALCVKRSGQCPLANSTGRFLLLFPLSAAFWWLYEYLNRFVQNWEYLLPRTYSAGEYFILATASFSTVLPAICSTAALLRTFPRICQAFSEIIPLPTEHSRIAGMTLASLAIFGLLVLPIFPNVLYPLLWLAPLLLWIAMDLLFGQRSIFPETAAGDWSRVATWSFAALVCGFFWEIWNYHSLSKWVYHVPYVGWPKLFEMPLLGYLGYLPFGGAAAAVSSLLFPTIRRLPEEYSQNPTS